MTGGILLGVIYIAFIGLGLPDSLFGTAWPAIYPEFGLPFSYGSFISAVVYCGTMAASIRSADLIARFGTCKITVFSTALTALSLLAFSYTGDFLSLCLCAIPLGLGAGCIDTALNHYVSLNYPPKHMNFMHCFYGIGISAGPYIFSRLLSQDGGWRIGYRAAFAVQAVIALILFLSFPLWKQAGEKNAAAGQVDHIRVIPAKEVLRMRWVRPVWLILICLSIVEITCNTWGATYLVEHKGMSSGLAAGVVMFYFAGMACGRFAAGLAASRLGSMRIIIAGQAILTAALVILIFSSDKYLAAAGLFLTGFGNGPLFPNITYSTFPADICKQCLYKLGL